MALRTPGRLHNLYHFAAFFIGALLLLRPARRWTAYVLRGAALVAMAALGEKLEVLVYHNGFEWHDVKMDSLAIIAGMLACVLWRAVLPSAPISGEDDGPEPETVVAGGSRSTKA
jgi:hypothetical protein